MLPSFVVYRTSKIDEARFGTIREQLEQRLNNLWTQAPILYRRQNAGDYEIPLLTPKAGLETPGTTGFALHSQAET